MRNNTSNIDRIIRLVLGVGAIAGSLVLGIGSVGGVLALVVGGVLLVTGAVGYCPLYQVLGISTCPVRK